MKLKNTLFIGLATGLLATFSPRTSSAAVLSSENFDTNWPNVPWGITVYSNAANLTTGWRVQNINIRSTLPPSNSPPYRALFPAVSTGASWIVSSMLSNGIGSVQFAARNNDANKTNFLGLESSYETDEINWVTNAIVTNTLYGAYTNFVVQDLLNPASNQIIRLRKYTSGTSLALAVDDILVRTLAGSVSLSGLTRSPSSPAHNEPVAITANITLNGSVDSFAVTNFWREFPDTNWTAIAMASNTPASFITSSNIPGKPIGAVIEYFAKLSYTVDDLTSSSQSATNSYTVRALSGFTNMSVKGGIVTNLLLVGNCTWQGVASVSNLIDAAIRFEGTSNTVVTTWGDTNQIAPNMPVYGTAEPIATNIILHGTNTGFLVLSFNETNREYSVQRCTFSDFDSWGSAPFGTYTNAHWVLSDGQITNGVSQALRGQTVVLNGKPNSGSNSFIRTPFLTNGTGRIGFWYRNWETNATPAGTLQVQVATSTTSAVWTTAATITNIISPNYLYFSLGLSDWANHAVRIVNNPAGSTARICLDEIVITDPGAGVTPSNLTNSPSNPTLLDEVSIEIDLTPISGALITNAIVWFRLGTEGLFDTRPMTNSGTHWSIASPISHPDIGTLQYAVQYFFSGFQNDTSPAFYPPAGTNAPASCTVVSPTASRSENFDTNWPNVPWGITIYSNAVNPTTGWRVQNINIRSTIPAPTSTPYRAKFPDISTGETWIASSMLSNGIGSVQFALRNNDDNQTNFLGIESCYEADGVNWITNAIVTNTLSATYAKFVLQDLLNPTSNQIIRLRKYSSGTRLALAVDDILITYPPANVVIDNVFLSPGYPTTGDSVTVSCDVSSINSMFPAYGISPRLWYRGNNETGFTNIPMTHTSGHTYSTLSSDAIAAQPRDTKVSYYIVCSFAGYHGSEIENRSPQYYPAQGSNNPAFYIVRTSRSAYSNITAVVNGQDQAGRLVADRTWQSIVNLTNTSSFSFALSGYGYSTDNGYSTNTVTWGNSSNWQTTIPLADTAVIGQTNIVVTNGSFSGQYVVRFNETNGEYTVQACGWQDFDNGVGDGITYKGTFVGSGTGGAQQNFDTWRVNTTYTRSEDFSGIPWNGYTAFTSGVGGGLGWLIYNSKYSTANNESIQTFTNIPNNTYSFIAQASHWGNNPLRGIGQVSYSYLVPTTNTPVSLGAFLGPTNFYPPPDIGETVYTTFLDFPAWSFNPNFLPVVNATNTTPVTKTVFLATNQTFDIIFAHLSGTQSVYFGNVSVSEWYSESHTTDVSGWVGTGYYIEPGPNGNTCRLDATRTSSPADQYIRSPAISGGIKYIEFSYSGSCFEGSPSNNPISFRVELSTNSPSNWSLLDAVSTNFNNNLGTTYYTYKRTLDTSTPNLYVRIKNTTPRPGALLLDNISIPGYASSNDWAINNVAVHYRDQQYPPAVRQFYCGAAYLNNSRTANLASPSGSEFPNTNVYPYIRSPQLANGVGDISFWYRNWTTNGIPLPSKLYVQTAVQNSDEGDWTNNTVAIITNIVNTNDYLYFELSLYDTTSRYVRIYSDDTYTTSVSRVCLDDILITAPLASSLTLSNLTITPSIPLSTNTVEISVDAYRLFYHPAITGMTGYYATASSYGGLATAALNALPMTCIATNTSAQGKWFRFKTTVSNPIPAQSSDTFVKYFAQASFTGRHTEVTSPLTNKTFGAYPAWLAPLDKLNSTSQAYYVVLSCPPGSVWINEINAQDLADLYDDPQPKFIEICGKTDVSLQGWTIQILSTVGQTQDTYVVTDSFTLPDATNGFGFFVLGDTMTSGRDMTLTNSFPTLAGTGALPYEGGIRLIRKSGIYADAVAYAQDISYVSALTNIGFAYAGDDSISLILSLSLTGTGSLNSAFGWINTAAFSSSLANDSQYLQGTSQSNFPAPLIAIVGFLINSSNVWIECANGTNGWSPSPWFSTNLLNTNGWVRHMPFDWSLSPSNTYHVDFPRTNLTPCFYKIVITNGP
jgi:hypothetical protein